MIELQRQGVRAVAVMSSRDIVEDAHVAARQFMVELDQVDTGRRRFPGVPLHFTDPSQMELRGASGLGQDNDQVMRDVLGYSPEQVAALYDAAVLHEGPSR
jgi:crotonobetainyl-CoA:carnitine CoA-transferase CaiB-like acyl-CoA transferase